MSIGATSELSNVPTTVVLEHHDSYTRNLLSLFAQVVQIDNGQTWDATTSKERVVIINVDSISWSQFVDDILPHVDCVVLGPGPGSPHRKADFSWPTRLIEQFGDDLPVFGLCLGHQGIAKTFGARVVRSAAPRHGQITRVRHTGDRLFASMPHTFDSVQYNSLTVDPTSIPDELEPIAWATNTGRDEILGLRHRQKPLWGVQYHPESICSSFGERVLSNFWTLVADHLRSKGRILSPSLPNHVRTLSTSLQPKLGPVLLDNGNKFLWQRRTVWLGRSSDRNSEDVFASWIKGRSELGEVWLDSARPSGRPQFSHMFNPQATWTYSRPANVVTIRKNKISCSRHPLPASETFFSYLASAQEILSRGTRQVDQTNSKFPIGLVGYFGYEMREESMPLSRRSGTPQDSADSEFAVATLVLTLDHEASEWIASGLLRVDGSSETDDPLAGVGATESQWRDWVEGLKQFFDSPPTRALDAPKSISIPPLVPDLARTEYIAAIEQAQRSIRDGDAYELCLTTQFRTTVSDSIAQDPFDLYRTLRVGNPAPYSYYFRLPLSNLTLLSSSPERFMQIDDTGRAEMKPIKGTVKRSDDPVEDERRRAALQADEKERAENLMIVDLSRNDLLAFCGVESVQVPRLMVVESYQTVHQLVTSVVGNLMPGVSPFTALEKAFPPGSMTGAPKLRSLKLLDDLEGRRPRGVYSGAFGYVSVDGSTDFSVVIRTLVLRGNQMTLGAGGAITHQSDPVKEWEEVLVKKDAVMGKLLA